MWAVEGQVLPIAGQGEWTCAACSRCPPMRQGPGAGSPLTGVAAVKAAVVELAVPLFNCSKFMVGSV